MFALPSEGTNPIFGGVLGELEGTFSKVPSNNPRPLNLVPHKKPASPTKNRVLRMARVSY